MGATAPQGKRNPWSRMAKRVFSLLLQAILMILCFTLYLGILPFFVIVMTPLYLYRFLVIAVQKLLKPEWIGIMSTRDALVGLDDYSKHGECVITLLLAMKGEPDINFIRKVWQENVLEGKNKTGELGYLKLLYYFESWMGFTFWKNEKNFSLENHIRMFDTSEIDPNNNEEVTEDQLMQCLGPLSTRPFPKGTSPWEVLIIKNFKRNSNDLHTDYKATVHIDAVQSGTEKDAHYGVILRMHHAIADGYSIMKLLLSNICGDPLSVVPTAPVRKISPLTTLMNYVAIIFFTPYYHFSQFFFNVDRSIWHLPTRKLTKEWQLAMTERISFEGIKAISKRHKVCVTATLLAGVAGGIYNFLKKKGQAARNTHMMRGLSPMPWRNHPMDTLCNHWTLGQFEVPVHETCPRKRLIVAHKNVEGLKKSPILVTNFLTVPIFLGAPNWLTDFLGTNWMTSMIISNFPGPNWPGKAFNHTQYIDEVVAWMPHMRGTAGLGMIFLSYNGGLRVSLSVDKAIISSREELDELTQLISQEYWNLQSLQLPTETVV